MQLSITLIIVIITALVSIGGFSNRQIIDDLIFYPPAVTEHKQWYRFFSCGLIHADWGHLIFNMLALYLFGVAVELEFQRIFGVTNGKVFYVLMYVAALAVCLLPTFSKHKDNYYYRSLGASGAVSAVMFAGILLAPTVNVYVYFIKLPGFVFAPLYLVITSVMDKRGTDNVNHSAHLWGALFGLAFVIVVGKLVADNNAISDALAQIQAYLGM